MAYLNFNTFSDEQIDPADLQDRLIKLERSLNYGFRSIDSVNVKRLYTNQTIIKSSDGLMDLTGKQMRMYDNTSMLRFRVGMSTANVYDLTMWSSDAATTDYDFSSNASVYIDSAGEVTFAGNIQTKKDAIVGDSLYVGYNNTTDQKVIRLRSFSTGVNQKQDMTFRVNNVLGGLLEGEIGVLQAADPITAAMTDLESFHLHTAQGLTLDGAGISIVNAGGANISNSAAAFTIDAAADLTLKSSNDVYLHGSSVSSGRVYINISAAADIKGDVILPLAHVWQGTTDSTNQVLTNGFLSTWLADNYAKINSPTRAIKLDYNSVGGYAEIYSNNVLQVRALDFSNVAHSLSSDRVMTFDSSAIAATTMYQFGVYKNTTHLGYSVMGASTDQKLNLEHIILLTTVGSCLETSGEYLLVYSSGTFKGGLKLDT